MSALQQLSIVILSCGHFTFSQTINGSYFNGIQKSQFENAVLDCEDDIDCIVNCSAEASCRGTDILCPITNNTACNVTCNSNQFTCQSLDILWIPGQPNTLKCNPGCYDVPYPPPIDDNTPYSIHCDDENKCGYLTSIQCPKNAECNITCIGDRVCPSVEIFCPESASCNVNCVGRLSCADMIVHWSSNLEYAHLNCNEDTGCYYWTKLPSILYPPDNNADYEYGDFRDFEGDYAVSATVNCPTDGDCIVECRMGSCVGATINCPINGNCEVHCTALESCYWTAINGPIGHTFEVYCDRGCRDMQIHAENSGSFKFIAGKFSSYQVRGISIWFPERDEITHVKKAQVISYDDDGLSGYYGLWPISFYAIHGWLDVEVIYEAINEQHGAIMHCNINYTDTCRVADDSWTCIPSNTICDNPFNETLPPTLSPTYPPTAAPTLTPTISPTLEPTPYTSAPTLIPTLEPTHQPILIWRDSTTISQQSQETIMIIGISVSLAILLIIGIIIAWKIKNKSNHDKRPYKNVTVDDGKQDTSTEPETEMQGLNNGTN